MRGGAKSRSPHPHSRVYYLPMGARSSHSPRMAQHHGRILVSTLRIRVSFWFSLLCSFSSAPSPSSSPSRLPLLSLTPLHSSLVSSLSSCLFPPHSFGPFLTVFLPVSRIWTLQSPQLCLLKDVLGLPRCRDGPSPTPGLSRSGGPAQPARPASDAPPAATTARPLRAGRGAPAGGAAGGLTCRGSRSRASGTGSRAGNEEPRREWGAAAGRRRAGRQPIGWQQR